MAKVVPILVCLVVLTLDVTAGILGIEATQNKLGLAAAVLLVVAHAIAYFLGGCACICSQMEFIRASINRKLAATTVLLSWIALFAGFSLLLAGAMPNSNSDTLTLGGIMCFVHGGITVVYYVTATMAAHEAA